MITRHSSARTERLQSSSIRSGGAGTLTSPHLPAACGARHDHGRRPPPHPLAAPRSSARACVLRGATPRARTRRRIGAEKAGAICFGSLPPLAPGFARPAARRGTESARRETCAPSPGDAARAGGPVSFISLSLPNHEQRERASKQPIRDRVQKQARCFVRARPFSPPCVVLAQSACVCSV